MSVFIDFIQLLKSIKKHTNYNSDFNPQMVDKHLNATLEWLVNSVKYSPLKKGSAHSYRLFSGWNLPFPETTGYIIETFINYLSRVEKDLDGIGELSKELGDWLISIQMKNGACMEGLFNNKPKPIVFNTGQNMLGYVKLYTYFNEDKYLIAAQRSADFLIYCQNSAGSYSKYLYGDLEASYNVRCAMATLKLYEITNDSKLKESAIKNIQWTISNQMDNGWFLQNEFVKGKNVNTHAIAYVLEGLLGSYFILKDNNILDSILLTSSKLLKKYEVNRWLSGELDHKFNFLANYTCVTGNMQIAGVWLDIYEITNDPRYLNATLKIVDWYFQYHNISSNNRGIRGAVHGSLPHYGKYAPMKYPNWAAKFFVDMLMKLKGAIS